VLDRAGEGVEAREAVQLVGVSQFRASRARRSTRSTRRTSATAPETDARPCRRAANENRAGSANRVGVPCTNSATHASDWSVRARVVRAAGTSEVAEVASFASARTLPSRFRSPSSRRTRDAAASPAGAPQPSLADRCVRSSAAAPARPRAQSRSDHTGRLADNGGMRIGGEAADGRRVPMIAAREPDLLVRPAGRSPSRRPRQDETCADRSESRPRSRCCRCAR